MIEAKNTARALVRIGYDGRVHKTFRATNAKERFDNEVKVLRYLEQRGCHFVPRLLEADPAELLIITTNCGARVEQISDQKMKSLFDELETFGVRHNDPFLRNITYRATDGRFCLIDFEFATILDEEHAAETRAVVDTTNEPALASLKPLSLRWSGMTDRGPVRANNEDVFLSIAFNQSDFRHLGRAGQLDVGEHDVVFAVSDGLGGDNAGEFASRCTIDGIMRLLPRRFHISPAHYSAGITSCLHDLFRSIHAQLITLGRSHAAGHNMGATLSLIWYVGGTLYFGHIGDSRIYHLPREGGMRQITDDHTHVGWLRRNGKMTEREARQHPRKNVLSQSLGSGNQFVNPQFGQLRCEPGDRFLLCTDGVTDGLWDRRIEELLCSPPPVSGGFTPAQRLVQAAVGESGRDNATALVVEIAGVQCFGEPDVSQSRSD